MDRQAQMDGYIQSLKIDSFFVICIHCMERDELRDEIFSSQSFRIAINRDNLRNYGRIQTKESSVQQKFVK